MRYIVAGVIGALLFVAIVGTGTDGAQLAAERTAQVQAQQAAQTERTAITEAAHTERTAINADLLRWQMAQEAQSRPAAGSRSAGSERAPGTPPRDRRLPAAEPIPPRAAAHPGGAFCVQ